MKLLETRIADGWRKGIACPGARDAALRSHGRSRPAGIFFCWMSLSRCGPLRSTTSSSFRKLADRGIATSSPTTTSGDSQSRRYTSLQRASGLLGTDETILNKTLLRASIIWASTQV